MKVQRRNDPFVCLFCGEHNPPAEKTCRDHCRACLSSLHVDVLPGDRAASCQGRYIPVGVRPHPKKGMEIAYICEGCGQHHTNKAAEDDDMDRLIALSVLGNDRLGRL